MRYSIYMVMMLVVSFLLSPTVASADDNQERVYGRELMTEQERKEERQKMRSMSEDDREQYRAEKHERMKERAKEQNKIIPDEPGMRGKGMRQGQGQGMGGGRR